MVRIRGNSDINEQNKRQIKIEKITNRETVKKKTFLGGNRGVGNDRGWKLLVYQTFYTIVS